MTWKGWTALGLVGAAVLWPIMRKRFGNTAMNNFDSTGELGSADTMGGMAAPASNTWAQNQTP